MHCQKAYIKVKLRKKLYKNNSLFVFFFIQIFTFQTKDQLINTDLGNNLVPFFFFFFLGQMNLTSPIKKNNFDLQVSSYKAFYQNHLFFLFFFVFVLPSYVNNQQPVPKFNSSV